MKAVILMSLLILSALLTFKKTLTTQIICRKRMLTIFVMLCVKYICDCTTLTMAVGGNIWNLMKNCTMCQTFCLLVGLCWRGHWVCGGQAASGSSSCCLIWDMPSPGPPHPMTKAVVFSSFWLTWRSALFVTHITQHDFVTPFLGCQLWRAEGATRHHLPWWGQQYYIFSLSS